MKSIVCVKRVPDPAQAKIDKKTKTIIREGVENLTNPFDIYGIEEAVRLKEANGGESVALSMGPTQNEETLKEAISMGVDKGVLVSDKALAGSDTYVTSSVLGSAIEKIGEYDLIICGREALDGDTGQVGPGIAEKLGIPHVSFVRKIREISKDKIIVERMTEDGYQVIEANLPALITVVKGINEPRVPSLRGLMKAKKAEITVWDTNDLSLDPLKCGLKGSPTQVINQFSPEVVREADMIKGEPDEQVSILIEKLQKMQIV